MVAILNKPQVSTNPDVYLLTAHLTRVFHAYNRLKDKVVNLPAVICFDILITYNCDLYELRSSFADHVNYDCVNNGIISDTINDT